MGLTKLGGKIIGAGIAIASIGQGLIQFGTPVMQGIGHVLVLIGGLLGGGGVPVMANGVRNAIAKNGKGL